jgi:hypothetical protein
MVTICSETRQLKDTVLHLDGSVTDKTNYGNDGTLNGGMSIVGGAFVFDGVDDSIAFTSQALTDFTFSAFVTADVLSGSLISDATPTDSIEIVNSTTIRAKIASVNYDWTVSALSTGVQYSIIVTRSGTTLTLYVDGASQGTKTDGTAIDLDRLGVGFDGSAKDFRIISRAITTTEIRELYNASVPGYEPPLPVRQIPDTVLHLEAASGERDLSNHCNYGTFEGTDIAADSTDTEFVFNGTDDYIDGEDTASLSVTGDLSVFLWMKATDGQPAGPLVPISKWDSTGSNERSWLFRQEATGKLQAHISSDGTSGANYETTDVAVFPNGQTDWFHVGFVYDATAQTVTIYVDGASVASTTTGTIPASIYDSVARLIVGGQDTGTGIAGPYAGAIDDTRVLAGAMTAGEVALLYNKGVRGYRPVGLLGGEVLSLHPSRYISGNDIADESGNGNNGTLTNGAYVGEDDEIVFDGVDDYVAVAHDASLNWGSGDGTVSVWVKFTTDKNAYTCFLVKGAGGASQKRYQLVTESDGTTPRFDIDDDGGVLKTIGHDASINDGEWHHLAGVRDGNNLRLYVDGVETTSSPTDITGYGSIDDIEGFTLGASNTSGSQGDEQYYDGSIRHPQVFNRALTAAEVAFLASEYEVQVPNLKGATLGIIPSYDDWGNATLNAIDFSGNGNVGTLTNMTTGDWIADTDSGGTRAIEYDGTDDYTEVLSSASLNSPTTSLTVSVWVKPSSTDDGIFLLKFNTSPPSGGGDYWFDITSSKFSAKSYGATGIVNALAVFSPDTWYNLTLVWISGVSLRFYIDGVLQGTDVSPGSITSAAFPLWIARWNADHLDGLVDDAYIFPRALSLDEIKALASTRNYFDCPVVSAIIQTRRRRMSMSGGML